MTMIDRHKLNENRLSNDVQTGHGVSMYQEIVT